MRESVDWKNDPVVLIEKHLYPLLPRLLRHVARGDAPDTRLTRQVRDAAEMLRAAQHRYLDALEIQLSEAALAQFARLASRLDRLAIALDSPTEGDAVTLLSVETLSGPLAEEVETTIDALRADFLGEVLGRQIRAKELSAIAAREVTSISRQIYFISINASVEAARAGEAGRGFAVIGEQIRSLSQDASAALRRLADHGAPGQ